MGRMGVCAPRGRWRVPSESMWVSSEARGGVNWGMLFSWKSRLLRELGPPLSDAVDGSASIPFSMLWWRARILAAHCWASSCQGLFV